MGCLCARTKPALAHNSPGENFLVQVRTVLANVVMNEAKRGMGPGETQQVAGTSG
jgi:hypothetical protein